MSDNIRHTAAFQQIYADTYEKVFHFIYRLTAKNDVLTDDIVQNVYLSLWEKIDGVGEGSNLPLLYTIAKRQLIDHYRKTLAEQAKLAGWMKLLPEEGSNTTTDQLAYKEINKRMEKVLSNMPERRRTIFILCREEGLSHREIAGRMDISIDTVQQQMNLALRSLQKEFRYFRQGETAILLAVAMLSLNDPSSILQ
jgi:RNA polymerase sigma-70 factor (family 1)